MPGFSFNTVTSSYVQIQGSALGALGASPTGLARIWPGSSGPTETPTFSMLLAFKAPTGSGGRGIIHVANSGSANTLLRIGANYDTNKYALQMSFGTGLTPFNAFGYSLPGDESWGDLSGRVLFLGITHSATEAKAWLGYLDDDGETVVLSTTTGTIQTSITGSSRFGVDYVCANKHLALSGAYNANGFGGDVLGLWTRDTAMTQAQFEDIVLNQDPSRMFWKSGASTNHAWSMAYTNAASSGSQWDTTTTITDASVRVSLEDNFSDTAEASLGGAVTVAGSPTWLPLLELLTPDLTDYDGPTYSLPGAAADDCVGNKWHSDFTALRTSMPLYHTLVPVHGNSRASRTIYDKVFGGFDSRLAPQHYAAGLAINAEAKVAGAVERPGFGSSSDGGGLLSFWTTGSRTSDGARVENDSYTNRLDAQIGNLGWIGGQNGGLLSGYYKLEPGDKYAAWFTVGGVMTNTSRKRAAFLIPRIPGMSGTLRVRGLGHSGGPSTSPTYASSTNDFTLSTSGDWSNRSVSTWDAGTRTLTLTGAQAGTNPRTGQCVLVERAGSPKDCGISIVESYSSDQIVCEQVIGNGTGVPAGSDLCLWMDLEYDVVYYDFDASEHNSDYFGIEIELVTSTGRSLPVFILAEMCWDLDSPGFVPCPLGASGLGLTDQVSRMFSTTPTGVADTRQPLEKMLDAIVAAMPTNARSVPMLMGAQQNSAATDWPAFITATGIAAHADLLVFAYESEHPPSANSAATDSREEWQAWVLDTDNLDPYSAVGLSAYNQLGPPVAQYMYDTRSDSGVHYNTLGASRVMNKLFGVANASFPAVTGGSLATRQRRRRALRGIMNGA